MGNPFQDQLLKAGLVNKKQASKAKRATHASRKKKKDKDTPSAITVKAREAQASQAMRSRELNRLRAEEKLRHEKKAQVKQLIEASKLDRDEYGKAYHFVEQGKINRIFVAEEMAEQLSRGLLAIVKFGTGYEVVPEKVASQIASRDKDIVLVLHR